MSNFIFLFLTTVILLCPKASDGLYASRHSLEERILGGATAPSRSSIASVRVSNLQGTFHICGGFVINRRWAGTAAQCLTGYLVPNIVIAVGTTTIVGGIIYTLSEIQIHFQYNELSLLNDIGLLRTSSDIQFTATVQPVIFNPQTIGGSVATLIYGWGRTAAGSGLSNNLLRQTFTTVTTAVCRDRFPYVSWDYITDDHLCTSATNAATCPGDAGGPMFLQETLVGIVSWVEPCIAGQTNVNTRISSYINWIHNFTRTDD